MRDEELLLKDKSDVALIQATIDGDRNAYAVLVEKYANNIFAICLGIVANVDDAKDISQDTMLKGFMKIEQLRNHDSFRPWIVGIARNLSFDHLRRNKKETALAQIRNDAIYEIPDKFREIHRAISQLPEKYRIPLLMYYFDGRSSNSVAEALNLSRDGVLTRLSRGRMELRRIIASWEKSNE